MTTSPPPLPKPKPSRLLPTLGVIALLVVGGIGVLFMQARANAARIRGETAQMVEETNQVIERHDAIRKQCDTDIQAGSTWNNSNACRALVHL